MIIEGFGFNRKGEVYEHHRQTRTIEHHWWYADFRLESKFRSRCCFPKPQKKILLLTEATPESL